MYVTPGRERNAMEIILKAILLLASAPPALGLTQLPSSLAQAPEPFGRIAPCILALGCLVSLVGITWHDRDTGVAVQRAGLVGVAVGGFLYAIALAKFADTFGQIAIAFGMSLGIACGAVARRRQLGQYVRRRTAEAAEDCARDVD